ncbi:TetR/AcrR family transcriptional regulator [uncultured Cohaesibacter sp.]|uniref:TetR/AcrR family transcriptional regulator n=1 Tax=uncultured Cohaesibacter sp. TaxID=1002546 RepID=UPI0029303DF4|nr:TetR/AcrR family transcriptional regulator [uncultured Cohaesibacter sp.]
MTETQDKIMMAALELFTRYGIQRTSMADIAKQAGLSRQTVYTTFASKDDLIAETIANRVSAVVDQIREKIADCKSLGEQLDFYFELMVIRPFEFLIDNPDAAFLWRISRVLDQHPAILKAQKKHRQLLADLFVPYTKSIGSADQTPFRLADFIMMTCRELKVGEVKSRKELDQLVETLQATILAITKAKEAA